MYFSKNALAEAEDIDGDIEHLFDFAQECDVLCFTREPISDLSTEHGDRQEKLKSWFYVITDKEKLFFILQYSEDTFDPDNVGFTR